MLRESLVLILSFFSTYVQPTSLLMLPPFPSTLNIAEIREDRSKLTIVNNSTRNKRGCLATPMVLSEMSNMRKSRICPSWIHVSGRLCDW